MTSQQLENIVGRRETVRLVILKSKVSEREHPMDGSREYPEWVAKAASKAQA